MPAFFFGAAGSGGWTRRQLEYLGPLPSFVQFVLECSTFWQCLWRRQEIGECRRGEIGRHAILRG